MTTLYRPVLIESAEQAEALPTGTLARHAAGSGMDHAHKIAPIGDPTPLLAWVSLTGLVSNAAMTGWSALVPIEAEEETVDVSTWATPGRTITRLVTPWEEAQ